MSQVDVLAVREARHAFIKMHRRDPVAIKLHPKTLWEIIDSCKQMEFEMARYPETRAKLMGMWIEQDVSIAYPTVEIL
jgi:hypothetical protein